MKSLNKQNIRNRKKKMGIVISNKMNKTVIVYETRIVKHKYYGKRILKKKKYFVHDEKNISKKGDKVNIMETRPISKNKCWRLIGIINK